jgi:protein TonB
MESCKDDRTNIFTKAELLSLRAIAERNLSASGSSADFSQADRLLVECEARPQAYGTDVAARCRIQSQQNLESVPKASNQTPAVAGTLRAPRIVSPVATALPKPRLNHAGESTTLTHPVANHRSAPKANCADPNREASGSNIVQPAYPESAKDLGLGAVTVIVQVTIGASGSLEEASVVQSSGNMAIDQSALRAARQSTYTPQLKDCSPTTGTYTFHAEFSPDN